MRDVVGPAIGAGQAVANELRTRGIALEPHLETFLSALPLHHSHDSAL